MVKCKSFWGHDYQHHTEEENGHNISFDWCWKCGDRKNDRYSEYESIEYEIYTITAPFGIIYNNLHGSISGHSSGFLFFFSGSVQGSISTDLEETYIIKYMDGNELKTKKYDAFKKSIVVDGKLCLEHKFRVDYRKDEKGRWFEHYRYDSDWSGEWIIHLPKLPEIEKMTTKYPED